MMFVANGDRLRTREDLPAKLIVVTLLELLGYGVILFFIGWIFGPIVLDIVLSISE